MTRHTNLLLVDDDKDITSLLSNYLARFGYITHVAHNGDSMREQLLQHSIDLVVMDVMLPGTDGFALAREIRQSSVMPLIILTARSDPYDRITGLENGADDYIIKPFELRELVARIHAVLRRTMVRNDVPLTPLRNNVICFDNWELHREERTLRSPDGLVVGLSTAEFRLLWTFLQTPRRLCSRDQLIEQARGRSLDAFDRSIDLLVSRLRQKLAQQSDTQSIIKTVRGGGYMLNVQSVHGRSTWKN